MAEYAYDYREKYEPSWLDAPSVDYNELMEAQAELAALREQLEALQELEDIAPRGGAYDADIRQPMREIIEKLRWHVRQLAPEVRRKEELYEQLHLEDY